MYNINELFFTKCSFEGDAISQSTINVTIQTVEAIALLTNTTCLVIDFDKQKLIYHTDDLLYIDEAIPADIHRECENPYWSLVPEEILDKLIKLRGTYLHFSRILSQEGNDIHFCSTDYPIHINKKKFYINQKFMPLVKRSDGTIRLGLFMYGPSTGKKMNSIIIGKSGERWCYDFQTEDYEKQELSNNISSMEKKIVRRIMKGMTNEEIADDLNIGVNTVKSYRLRLFRKLGVKTITEAITIISNYHLV